MVSLRSKQIETYMNDAPMSGREICERESSNYVPTNNNALFFCLLEKKKKKDSIHSFFSCVSTTSFDHRDP